RPLVDAAAEENCALDRDRNRLAVSSRKRPPPDRWVGLEGGDGERGRIQRRRIAGPGDAKEVILAAERAAMRFRCSFEQIRGEFQQAQPDRPSPACADLVAARRARGTLSPAGVDRIEEKQRRSTS